MHKFVKNEKKIEPTTQDKQGNYISDIMNIIEYHTTAWSEHWKADDKGHCGQGY